MADGAPDDALLAAVDALELDDDANYADLLLENLFTRLTADHQSPYVAQYGALIKEDRSALAAQLSQCLSTRVHRLFSDPDGLIHRNSVLSLGGNVASHGPAIYMHLVQTSDEQWYWYIGQAFNLSARINQQHRDFRYRRDHPSLHYYVHERSINDRFVVLANLDDCSVPISSSNLRTVLSLLEMWCCLLFRCLPPQTLSNWLSDEDYYDLSFDGPIKVLNVALPLDHGNELACQKAFELLKDSDDSLAQQYYVDVRAGNLRARATPRKARTKALPPVAAPAAIPDSSDMVVGFLFGVFGTLTVLLLRRSWIRFASRIGQTSS